MDWKRAKEEQMRTEALEALKLSEKNRKLADRCLDPEFPEDELLLKEIERQDLHALESTSLKKSKDYMGYCEKEQFTGELGRFLRFTAAVGGSTVYYILDNPYGRLEWLSASQQAAVLAEMTAWEEMMLNRANLMLLFFIGEKNPRAIRKAVGLCVRRGYNVQILLHGIYLYHVRPKGVMVGKYVRETEHAAEMSEHLFRVLVNCLPLLSADRGTPSGEADMLKRFAKESEPSEEFPEVFRAWFGIRRFSGYLLRLLGGAAFLSIEHSERFLVFLRILAAMDLDAVLDACLDMSGDLWFRSHLEKLEKVLPVSMENYVQWCVQRKMGDALTRVSLRDPKAIQKAAASLPADGYQYLMTQMKAENPKICRQLNLAFAGVFRIRLAEDLASWYCAGRLEAKRYLLGKAGPETIYPFVQDWRNMELSARWDYEGKRTEQIDHLKTDPEYGQMYRRAVVLEGLCMNIGYFGSFHVTGRVQDAWSGMDEEELLAIIAVFETEKIRFPYQMELLEQICSARYSPAGKKEAREACVRALIRKKEAWNAWYVAGLKNGSAFSRSLYIEVLGSFGDEYKKALLSCSMDGSAQVQNILTEVFIKHREWEPELRAMLTSPRIQERQIAAQVFRSWGLEKDIPGESAQDPQELADTLLKGGQIKKVSWALEDMPAIHKKDGSEVTEEEMAALLLCYAGQRFQGAGGKAALLSAEFSEKELASYMGLLLKRWFQTDADSGKKWVLCAASVHGGAEVVPVFRMLIQELPGQNRRLMAAEAVKALALNKSTEALALVEQTSKRSRYQGIREAAADVFSQAAVQRGITGEELRDQMVPDLGFDRNGVQIFDYGNRHFQVVLTSALTLEIFDGDGKQLKNMPAPGKQDDQTRAKAANAAFKQLKKQLKAVAEDQRRYMERVLLNGRRWSTEAWKALFLEKAVMHPFAMGLIWGSYEERQLLQSFRYMEDGSLSTVNGEVYELPGDSRIGLVHPMELTEEERSAWKKQLADYEIIQPVVQL